MIYILIPLGAIFSLLLNKKRPLMGRMTIIFSSVFLLTVSIYFLSRVGSGNFHSYDILIWKLDDFNVFYKPVLTKNNAFFVFLAGFIFLIKCIYNSKTYRKKNFGSYVGSFFTFFVLLQVFFANSLIAFLIMCTFFYCTQFLEYLHNSKNQLKPNLKSYNFVVIFILLSILSFFLINKIGLVGNGQVMLSNLNEFFMFIDKGSWTFYLLLLSFIVIMLLTFPIGIYSKELFKNDVSPCFLLNGALSLLFLLYFVKTLMIPLGEEYFLMNLKAILSGLLLLTIVYFYQIIKSVNTMDISLGILKTQFLMSLIFLLLGIYYNNQQISYSLCTMLFVGLPLGLLIVQKVPNDTKTNRVSLHISKFIMIFILLIFSFNILYIQKFELSTLLNMLIEYDIYLFSLFLVLLIIKLSCSVYLYKLFTSNNIKVTLFDTLIICFILSFNIVLTLFPNSFMIG